MIGYLILGGLATVLLIVVVALWKEKKAAARRATLGNRAFSLHTTALKNESRNRPR